MRVYLKRMLVLVLSILSGMGVPVSSCAAEPVSGQEIKAEVSAGSLLIPAEEGEQVPEFPGASFTGKTDFVLAENVEIYYYGNGYKYITVRDGQSCLLVPEGADVPENIPEDVVILPVPARRIYLAATSAMALFQALDGLDHIRMSSLNADGWYVEEARKAMEAGDILYAGKYSEPDFELLLDQDCDLAVESTMILHSPKVKEMIEQLGIPVFIDRSSYEDHPLGRSEWIKVYGAMIGREAEADAFFRKQLEVLDEMKGIPDTGKSIAFFSVNTGGSVVVRRPGDYVPEMIRIAGGRYILDGREDLEDGSATSTVNMTMEDFYNAAADADILIYNASIEAPLGSVAELLDKNELFGDFEAVKNGNVWCTDRYLYQATDITGELIRDFHAVLTKEDARDTVFLTHLE